MEGLSSNLQLLLACDLEESQNGNLNEQKAVKQGRGKKLTMPFFFPSVASPVIADAMCESGVGRN